MLPLVPSSHSGPCPWHCHALSLPGALEKDGGRVCHEGWACGGHIVMTHMACELVSMEMGWGKGLCHLLRPILPWGSLRVAPLPHPPCSSLPAHGSLSRGSPQPFPEGL